MGNRANANGRDEGFKGRDFVGARCEIRSFRWHFPVKVYDCRRPLSLDASSAIGLSPGSVLSAALLSCFSVSLIVFLYSLSFYKQLAEEL